MPNFANHIPAKYLDDEFTISTVSPDAIARGVYGVARGAWDDAVEFAQPLLGQF